jgi:hypothetical protein
MISLMRSRPFPIPELMSQLEVLIQLRNIREGFSLLDELRKKLKTGVDLGGANPIPLALCLAQWMDLGYRDPTVLKVVMDRIPRRHAEMPFMDVMSLNLIEAFSYLSAGDLDRAIALLERTAIAVT